MKELIDREDLLERFLAYCRLDTQACEESTTRPSSDGQIVLIEKLALELAELGLEKPFVDPRGYVYASIPCTLPAGHPRRERVPPIGFIAHVDTAPGVPGQGVSPVLHRGYKGGDIVLKRDAQQVVSTRDNPELDACVGHDLVTTDGTTLLGADDKAGVAEIMALTRVLVDHPEIPHGPIKIAFTTDEEIGKGAEHFDIGRFGADYAYTLDGSRLGEIEDETFCADSAVVTIRGRNVHPGYAKGKMVNAIKGLASFVSRFPPDALSPETTEGREGYLHPHKVAVAEEEIATLHVLVRDFGEEGLREKEQLLDQWGREVEGEMPGLEVKIEIRSSYRNMKQELDRHPQVMALAEEAVRAAGLAPVKRPIRGGTDGAVLTSKGLPTPNIFTGGHSYHSKREWASVDIMMKTVETCLHLVRLWAEKGERKKE